jgi:hypothetical protein
MTAISRLRSINDIDWSDTTASRADLTSSLMKNPLKKCGSSKVCVCHQRLFCIFHGRFCYFNNSVVFLLLVQAKDKRQRQRHFDNDSNVIKDKEILASLAIYTSVVGALWLWTTSAVVFVVVVDASFVGSSMVVHQQQKQQHQQQQRIPEIGSKTIRQPQIEQC